jgi:hypothetical protein
MFSRTPPQLGQADGAEESLEQVMTDLTEGGRSDWFTMLR